MFGPRLLVVARTHIPVTALLETAPLLTLIAHH